MSNFLIKLKTILVYIVDVDWHKEHEKFGANKIRFMLECIRNLDKNLQELGLRLFVLKGDAKEVMKKFCQE